jgi:MFS family permease
LGKYFHVTNQEQLILPVTTYLLGYTFGPLIFGPLSESYGRKLALVPAFIGYIIVSLGCGLSNNWPLLLFLRFLAGIFASSPLTVVGGVSADLYQNPIYRGRSISLAMAVGTQPFNFSSDELVNQLWT